MLKYLILLAAAAWTLAACAPAPQPIDFGSDVCDHCKMTIVEVPFAAEVVTRKGRAYKFDAIECMVAWVKGEDEGNYAYLLVRDFDRPDDWQDARTCSYLISENLPSPMGAYLSAYLDETGAQTMRSSKGGKIFDWENLKSYLNREPGMLPDEL